MALQLPADRTQTPTRRPVNRAAAQRKIPLRTPSFGAAVRQLMQAYDAELADVAGGAFTQTQYEVLDALSEHQPCSSSVLVEATGVDRSTLADVVRRLKKAGYIARGRRKDDQRAYATSLTAAGRTALREAHRAVQKADKAAARKIDPAVIRRIMDTLQQAS